MPTNMFYHTHQNAAFSSSERDTILCQIGQVYHQVGILSFQIVYKLQSPTLHQITGAPSYASVTLNSPTPTTFALRTFG
jgi:hypothetical protein